MRIVCAKSSARSYARRAFTMIEIAIALAVIGFALLAIVGLLPMGLNVQKDNREDTVISQDGSYFIEAIRGGVVGLDILTNYVERIAITNFPNSGGAITVTNVTNIRTGADIIEMLSTPKLVPDRNPKFLSTNQVWAYVRALSGSASLQASQPQDANTALLGFRYRLEAEITPFNAWDRESTNFTGSFTNGLSSDEILEHSNRWVQVSHLTNNLYEVRLKLSWPVLPNGALPTKAKSQVFRTMISSALTNRIFDQTYQFP